MSQHLFQELITKMCNNIGLSNPERVIQSGGIVIGEVSFSLLYQQNFCPSSIYIYCDYGEVPNGNNNAIFTHLLKENKIRAKRQIPTISLSPDSHRIVSMHRFPLQHIEASILYEQLCHMVDAVRQWHNFRWS